MRAAVVEAMAWRVVSDLAERHGGRHPIALVQVFPDADPDPWLHLAIRPMPHDPAAGVSRWIARLGPQGGRCHVIRAGLDAWHGDFAEPLLAGDDAAFADRLDRALGLRAAAGSTPVPSAAGARLAVRLVAETLARESASRRPLTAVAGQPEIGGRSLVAGWTAGWPVDDHDPAGPPMAQDLVALQDAAIGAPALAADGERRAVVDLRAGRLWLAGGGVPAQRLDLVSCHARDGRRLSRLVERVRAHLGRPSGASVAVPLAPSLRIPESADRPPPVSRPVDRQPGSGLPLH